MSDHLSIGQVADRLGVKPVDISSAFYSRKLDCDRCPIIAGRRLVPADYLDSIAIEMRRAGKLPQLRRKAVTHVG